MNELMDTFMEVTRDRQLLIVQPTIAVMVYAANTKASCYTGFWQSVSMYKKFDYVDFLAAQALPGPGS